jgi:hypothetical protein
MFRPDRYRIEWVGLTDAKPGRDRDWSQGVLESKLGSQQGFKLWLSLRHDEGGSGQESHKEVWETHRPGFRREILTDDGYVSGIPLRRRIRLDCFGSSSLLLYLPIKQLAICASYQSVAIRGFG